MSRYLINLVVFLVGLAAAGWIGAGYVGSNPLALGVTLLIALFYMAGAFELYRYGRATSGLRQAVAGLEARPPRWPAGSTPCRPACATPPGCASKASAPPCPAPRSRPTWSACWSCWACSAPSWVWWSRWGTGLALESATDLHAIRASLAAPVKGPGFAFGTSIAGVATSAMLGLLSALCRRDRILASQQFDARVATTLRPYSQSYQREETLKLLQRQADAMPALAERLQP